MEMRLYIYPKQTPDLYRDLVNTSPRLRQGRLRHLSAIGLLIESGKLALPPTSQAQTPVPPVAPHKPAPENALDHPSQRTRGLKEVDGAGAFNEFFS